MITVHNKEIVGEIMNVHRAIIYPSFFGNRGVLTITSYLINAEEGQQRALAMRMSFEPANKNIPSSNWESGAFNNILRLFENNNGVKRIIEQQIMSRAFGGEILPMSMIDNNEAIQSARTLLANIIRTIECIVEALRLYVRDSFAKQLRDRCIDEVERLYGQQTRFNIDHLLNDINWGLMFDGSGCNKEFIDTVNYVTTHNPPRNYDIDYDGETGIAPLADLPVCNKPIDVKRFKAELLLGKVCGPDALASLRDKGYVVIENGGYKFKIKPQDHILCVDPKGKSARLCIHTISFLCHPIDEIVIACLYIKHRLKEYLKTANVFKNDPDFELPA